MTDCVAEGLRLPGCHATHIVYAVLLTACSAQIAFYSALIAFFSRRARPEPTPGEASSDPTSAVDGTVRRLGGLGTEESPCQAWVIPEVREARGGVVFAAVARDPMARPPVLLVDEASLVLAPVLVQELFRTSKGITLTGDTTVLLAQQSASIALAVSRRGDVMETVCIGLQEGRRASCGIPR